MITLSSRSILAALLGFALAAAPAVAQTTPSSPTSASAAQGSALTNEQLSEEAGWLIIKRVELSGFQFTPSELAGLLKGVTEGINGEAPPYDLQKAGPDMQAMLQAKHDAYAAALGTRNLAASKTFFAKLLQTNKAVVALPSGLCYEIVKPGNGAYPKPTDTVRVHYTGYLLDGTIFDTSRQPSQPGAAVEPIEFELDKVIPGWTEGLQKVNVGGQIKLYIPPQLAYGEGGSPNIPPNSALIFEVELFAINPAAPASSPAPAAIPAQ